MLPKTLRFQQPPLPPPSIPPLKGEGSDGAGAFVPAAWTKWLDIKKKGPAEPGLSQKIA